MLYVLLQSMQVEVLSSRDSPACRAIGTQEGSGADGGAETTDVVRASLLDRRSTAIMPDSKAAAYDSNMPNSKFMHVEGIWLTCAVYWA